MGGAIVNERNSRLVSGQRYVVELGTNNAPADAARVLDRDIIAGGMILEDDAEARPCLRYAGIEQQRAALQAEPQDRFEAESPGDYERIHRDQLARLPGVTRIRSAFAIRNVIRGT